MEEFAQRRPNQRSLERVLPWPEHLNRSAAAAWLCELGERTWVTAPVMSGAALRLSRPAKLAHLLRWADVALVEFPWQLPHCRAVAPELPIVLASHNVEIDKFESTSCVARSSVTRRPWLAYIERMERRALAQADVALAVSERDRLRMAERYGVDPARIVVARNGADVRAIRPAEPQRRAAARRALGLPELPTVLFAGSDVTANRRGLEWVRELARRSDRFTFLVAGRVGGQPRQEGSLRVVGYLDDFQVCLDAADMSICPKELGAGTKIKLIEAFAAGLPSVAFPESLKGLDVRDGEHVLAADKSAESLLSALGRLADDRELAARIGAAARRRAVEQHDWRDSAAAVEAALIELFENGRRARAFRPDGYHAAPRPARAPNLRFRPPWRIPCFHFVPQRACSPWLSSCR